jgi:hypothetical protein
MAGIIEIILNLAWIKYISSFLPMQTQMKLASYINSSVSCLHNLSKEIKFFNLSQKHQSSCKGRRLRGRRKKGWSYRWNKDVKKVCNIEERVHWKWATLQPIILEWMDLQQVTTYIILKSSLWNNFNFELCNNTFITFKKKGECNHYWTYY